MFVIDSPEKSRKFHRWYDQLGYNLRGKDVFRNFYGNYRYKEDGKYFLINICTHGEHFTEEDIKNQTQL